MNKELLMKTFRYLKPEVIELSEVLGAEVKTYTEVNQTNSFILNCWGGYYEVPFDFIALNDHMLAGSLSSLYPDNEINYSLLHELAHWSGHSSRLSREMIVGIESRAYPVNQDVSTEEMTAQWGMYYLMLAMGFPEHEAFYARSRLEHNYPKADMIRAEQDGKILADYLMERAAKAKVA